MLFLFSGCKGTGNIWFHQTIPALFYKIDVILLAVQVLRELQEPAVQELLAVHRLREPAAGLRQIREHC